MPLADRLKELRQPKPPAESPHVVVEALAGTGKTLTLVGAVAHLFRDRVPELMDGLVKLIGKGFEPTHEQLAVWEAVANGQGRVKNILFTSFGRQTVEHLERTYGWMARMLAENGVALAFQTLHTAGRKAIARTYGPVELNEYVTLGYAGNAAGIHGYLVERELRLAKHSAICVAVDEMASLCKTQLFPLDEAEDEDERLRVYAELDDLARRFGVSLEEDTTGKSVREEVYRLLPGVVARCRSAEEFKKNGMSYDDMVWLPVVLNLPLYKFDLVLVDEVQDLKAAEHSLVLRSGQRFVACGDRHQSIFAFAGSEPDGMEKFASHLERTKQGAVRLGLTVSQRCSKAVAAEAAKLVPEFKAKANAPDGVVAMITADQYRRLVRPGDMVLCRYTGPLVTECFALLRSNIPACVQGRDVGAGLAAFVLKVASEFMEFEETSVFGSDGMWQSLEPAHAQLHHVQRLLALLRDRTRIAVNKEATKQNPSWRKIQTLSDRYATIEALARGAGSVEGLLNRTQALFSDTAGMNSVRCSSIHKAKGLEARNVFLLVTEREHRGRDGKDKRLEQEEDNLTYVANTRARECFYYVQP